MIEPRWLLGSGLLVLAGLTDLVGTALSLPESPNDGATDDKDTRPSATHAETPGVPRHARR
jgi:hypothetical protein